MPPSTNNDGRGPLDFFEEEPRPSIPQLAMVPETREEKATRFTVRAVILTIIVIAIVAAVVVWRGWANAESRAEAVRTYDSTCDMKSAAQAVELLRSHGEPESEMLALRIQLEQAYEELSFDDVPSQAIDLNSAPPKAKVEAAIAETYRLLLVDKRQAAAQMISAVRTSSPAALRARVRAALAVGHFKYAADTLAAAPATSNSAALAEARAFVAKMVPGAAAPKIEGAYALCGALRGALALGDQAAVASLVPRLAPDAMSPRQKRWAALGVAYHEAHEQGVLLPLERLKQVQSHRVPGSDVYTLALSELLLDAGQPARALEEQKKIPTDMHGWLARGRLASTRVHANLMLGNFGKAEAEFSTLPDNALSSVLRGWSSMARGRTQAAQRHFSEEAADNVFASNMAELGLFDIAFAANARAEAEDHLKKVKSVSPRWRSEIELRKRLLAAPGILNRFSPPTVTSKPAANDPQDLAWHADAAPAAEAQKLYERVLSRVAFSAHANVGLFELAMAEGGNTDAIAKKLRFDSPFAARVAQAQGLQMLQQGDGSRGAANLWKTIARYNLSRWGELRFLRARLYAQAGEFVRAVREYGTAASLVEEQLDFWVEVMAYKSIAHAKLGAKGPAESVLDEIEKRVSEQGRDKLSERSEALWTAARARQSLADKKYVAAQMFAKRALKSEPQLVEALMVLVDFAVSKNREDLTSLRAAAEAPWPSYSAKRMLSDRKTEEEAE